MTKRSFFLTVAAGLLASVAFATPSQASSTYLVSAAFDIVPPTILATEITVTLSGPVPAAGYTVIAPGGLTGVSASGSGNTITISFAPNDKTTPITNPAVEVEFTAASGLGITGYSVGGGTTITGYTSSGLAVSIASVGVPEPTSMALLGIGMTGFLAFRRLFKRTAVA